MEVATDDPDAPDAPAEPVLKPQISAGWALRLAHLPAVALLGISFLLLNYLPLRPTDLWCHVSWGDWMIAHQQLPTEDPTFPLAQGMPVVATAWLSQVILAGVDRAGGAPWLSNLFALVTIATWLTIWRALYLRSGNWLTSLMMLGIVLTISFSRMLTIRPEIFAWLCFAILWWLLAPPNLIKDHESEDQSSPHPLQWKQWIGVPLVMMLWANLHGSFVCGLAVLAADAAGAILNSLWNTRSLGATLRSPSVQQRMLVAELGLLATCLNPYGIDLLISAIAFARIANLREVSEWQPFVFGGTGSYAFVASWLIAIVLLRFSKSPVKLEHVLALALFGLTTLAGMRMIGWFALTFGVAFMPLLHDLLGRFKLIQVLNEPPTENEEPGRGFPLIDRSWSYTLLALLLIWIAFALSPVSAFMLGTKPRTPAQLYGPDTPLGLTNYLQKNPISGPVFCPQWYGDWLRRAAPDVQPFMTSNIHLAPRLVWSDYLRVINLQSGWGNILGRYALEHAVVDKKNLPDLDKALRRDNGWQVQYEDDRTVLYALKKPAPAVRTTPVETPTKPAADPPTPDSK